MVQSFYALLAAVCFMFGLNSMAEKFDPVMKKIENFESSRPGNLDFPGNAAFPDF